MSPRKYLTLLSNCCGVVLLLSLPLQAQTPVTPVDGVEVLGRGPLHEAFAQPVDATAEPGPLVPQAPPALIDELPPDQKPEGDAVQWIPGYWQWDEDRKDFIWISGFWRVPPPGRQWVAGHYRKGDEGWQWVSGYWAGAGQTEEALLPPPPAPLDAVAATPAPSADSVYVPGNWVYRETRYRWRPGFYVDSRPGWVWNPAHYLWTPAGYVFIDGYWDYPLQGRGLLFAPVVIERRVLAPNWCYTPSYAIAPDFLPCALFARPAWGHYYFGDYFDAGYARRGFTAWIDVRIGGHNRDPLYDYDRRSHGREGWDRDLREAYAGRFNGDVPRPPRTLVLQNTHDKNVTRNNTASGFKSVTPLATLNDVNRKGMKLAAVNAGERKDLAQNVVQSRDVGRQRQASESRVLSAHAAPTRPGDAPHALKLDLPAVTVSKVVAQPPAVPVHERPAVVTPKEHKVVTTTDRPAAVAVKKEPIHETPPVQHQVPPAPAKEVTLPPTLPKTPKHDIATPAVRHETPPTMAKHEMLPPVKQASPPPPVKHEAPPPPPSVKHEVAPVKQVSPPPPPVKHEVAPVKQVSPPPPPVKHEASPPPKHEMPPAPPKHDAAPPTPRHDAPTKEKPKS